MASAKIDSLLKFLAEKGVILKILSILTTLILASTLIFFYFFIYLSPKAILLRAFHNINQTDAFKYSLDLNLKFDSNSGNYLGSQEGAIEEIVKSKETHLNYRIVTDGQIRLSGNADIESAVNILTDGKKVVNFDLLYKDASIFFKINDFLYKDYVDKQLQGGWIKIENDFWKNKNILNELGDTPNMSTDSSEFSVFRNFPLVITDKLPSDRVRGAISYHFKYKVNKDKLKRLISEKVNFFNPNLFKFIGGAEFSEGDLWVAKGGDLYRIKGSVHIDNVGSVGNYLDLPYDITFYRSNDINDIKPPQSYKNIDDILK